MYIYTYIYVYIYIYTQLNYFPRVIPTLTQFLTHHLEVYIYGIGGGGEDEGGRGLLKAAWQVRKIDRFRSCVGSVRGLRGSVSPWVRCGSLPVRAGSVGTVESMSPWGPCGSVGSVRVRGVRVSFGP